MAEGLRSLFGGNHERWFSKRTGPRAIVGALAAEGHVVLHSTRHRAAVARGGFPYLLTPVAAVGLAHVLVRVTLLVATVWGRRRVPRSRALVDRVLRGQMVAKSIVTAVVAARRQGNVGADSAFAHVFQATRVAARCR